MKNKNYRKVRDQCHCRRKYRSTAHSVCNCNLKNSVSKNILIAFHNGPIYDYQFNTKELEEEFRKQFTCLGENNEKYITFTVLIEKEVTRIDANREEIRKK